MGCAVVTTSVQPWESRGGCQVGAARCALPWEMPWGVIAIFLGDSDEKIDVKVFYK